MGGHLYSSELRSQRADALGYHTAPVDQVFRQNLEQRIHDSMNPMGVILRESRDSEVHPNALAIILGLDVTGSMGHIPVHLVRDGLPNLIGKVIEHGIPDPQIMFMGIGDHLNDQAPLQIGQFESGDEQLDNWLTKTWLEGKGGGNGGESYLLAWFFAANYTQIDCWQKRGQKGLLFTIGDERCHPNLDAANIRRICGDVPFEGSISKEELLAKAQETYDVYHLQIMEGSEGSSTLVDWQNLLGSNCIPISDYRQVDEKIVEIITRRVPATVNVAQLEAPIVTGDDITQPVFN